MNNILLIIYYVIYYKEEIKVKDKEYLDRLFIQRNCDICGKLVIPTPHWMYKTHKPGKGIKYYCSYNCYRKAGGDSGRYEYYVRNKRPRN